MLKEDGEEDEAPGEDVNSDVENVLVVMIDVDEDVIVLVNDGDVMMDVCDDTEFGVVCEVVDIRLGNIPLNTK